MVLRLLGCNDQQAHTGNAYDTYVKDASVAMPKQSNRTHRTNANVQLEHGRVHGQ